MQDDVAAPGLHSLLATRWSPTTFDPIFELGPIQAELLVEAARWAPSAGNSQPWAFIMGRRGDDTHRRLVRYLAVSSGRWAPPASLLVANLAHRYVAGTDWHLWRPRGRVRNAARYSRPGQVIRPRSTRLTWSASIGGRWPVSEAIKSATRSASWPSVSFFADRSRANLSLRPTLTSDLTHAQCPKLIRVPKRVRAQNACVDAG
jgi:nitroreductase